MPYIGALQYITYKVTACTLSMVHYCVQKKALGMQPKDDYICVCNFYLRFFHSFLFRIMNSLSGKTVLSLCRRTTTSTRVLANSTSLALPFGHGVTRSLLGAQRVCHSAANSKPSSIGTKKRGYDITRNPHLNKVMSFCSVLVHACFEARQCTSVQIEVIFSYIYRRSRKEFYLFNYLFFFYF